MNTTDKIRAALAELSDEYQQPHDHPWILAFSGGKDSTLVLQLVIEMLLLMAPSDRPRPVHVVGNDTLVESPLLVAHMRAMLAKLEQAADTLRVPITTHITVPADGQTFWCNVIGRGYPPPNRSFRWCTDRMKIVPTTKFIREQVSAAGKVVMLIGVRSAESANRAKIIEQHTIAGQRLNPHDSLRGCMVFRPIVDFTTDEVWQTLLQRLPPWGGSHRNLITLYRNAQAGECPMVIDRSAAPSCGSGSARFGCWTCTVVKKDKSAEALADAGFEQYGPLVEFRDWLNDLQHDRSKRQLERRDGGLTVINDQIMPGPFHIDARGEILERLLAVQAEVGMQLITEEEISFCKRQWAMDVVTKIRRLYEWTEPRTEEA